MKISVRPETSEDHEAIYAINTTVFDSSSEAELVEVLRHESERYISLVAERGGEIVGHIMFTPVTIENMDAYYWGLAPMVVAPSLQRQGVGSMLVDAGLEACRQLGAAAVVVLGHAGFYPRFGFRPASEFGLASEYDVPDEVFMAMELKPSGLADAYGVVKYHPAFNRL